MRVFVTGATGFVGSAVVQELISAGHQVLGLARSEESARSLAAAGAEVHRGALDDLDSLRSGVAATDGVIHTAFIHDFSNYAASAATDKLAIETIGAALEDSEHPFVVTSATALLPAGRLVTEEDTSNSGAAVPARALSDATALALASRGVRVSLVRLPPTVHGDGDHGFIPMLIGIAREKQTSAYMGEGQNRWPAVHRLDAAQLYRLALEKAPAGTQLHAVAEEGIPFRDIAGIIGKRLNLPVVSQAREEAADHFGWMATFVAIDNPTSSKKTQEQFGWNPTHPALIADLDRESYFRK